MLVPDNGLDRVQISLVSSPRQLEGVETGSGKKRKKREKRVAVEKGPKEAVDGVVANLEFDGMVHGGLVVVVLQRKA